MDSESMTTWFGFALRSGQYQWCLSPVGDYAGHGLTQLTFDDNGINVAHVWFLFPIGQTPTEADARAAVKRIAGIDLPEPEKEERWYWSSEVGIWQVPAIPEMYARITMRGDFHCTIRATTATRDSKRDALHAALKAAGKDGAE